MPAAPLGSINPALLDQCPAMPIPADAESLPVHVTSWGETGPEVLFVHGGVQGGIGGGPVNFLGQKPLSEMGWRLRLVDRPGFGDSPSRGPDDMEKDAVLVADMLGDGCHLVGHSFGGAVALLAAAQRPEAVRSLIMLEPALQPLLTTDPDSASNPATGAAMAIVAKFLVSSETPGEFAIGFLSSLGTNTEGDENTIAAALKANPAFAESLGCSLLRARMVSPAEMRAAADAVAAAGIPVLLISGGYSAGQEATCAAIARMTGGTHVVVEAPSHFLQQDVPDNFNRAVHTFLSEVEAGKAA